MWLVMMVDHATGDLSHDEFSCRPRKCLDDFPRPSWGTGYPSWMKKRQTTETSQRWLARRWRSQVMGCGVDCGVQILVMVGHPNLCQPVYRYKCTYLVHSGSGIQANSNQRTIKPGWLIRKPSKSNHPRPVRGWTESSSMCRRHHSCPRTAVRGGARRGEGWCPRMVTTDGWLFLMIVDLLMVFEWFWICYAYIHIYILLMLIDGYLWFLIVHGTGQ